MALWYSGGSGTAKTSGIARTTCRVGGGGAPTALGEGPRRAGARRAGARRAAASALEYTQGRGGEGLHGLARHREERLVALQ